MLLALLPISLVFFFLFLPLGFLSGVLLGSMPLGALIVIGALTAWYKPEWALAILLALVPLVRSPNSHVLPMDTMAYFKATMALVIGGIWWVRHTVNNEPFRFSKGILFLIVCWMSVLVLATINAADISLTLPHYLIAFAGIAAFVVTYNLDGVWRKRFLYVVGATALGVSLLAVLQYMIVEYRLFPSLWPYIVPPRELFFLQSMIMVKKVFAFRVESTFLHPNQLGFYYAMLVPIFAALLFVKTTRPALRAALAFTFVLMLVGFYLSNCRAGFVGVTIGVGFLVAHRQYRPLLLALLAIGVGALAWYMLSPEAVVDNITRIGRLESGLSSRETVWANALDMISRFPLLGVGPDNFNVQYHDHFGFFVFDNAKEILEQMARLLLWGQGDLIGSYHAHNMYLQMTAEQGFLAVPLFLLSLAFVIFHCERRAQKHPAGSLGQALALGTAAAAISLAVAGFFDSDLLFTQAALNLMAAPLLAMGLRA